MHHTQVYGGSFPIWVIIEYFSLGMLSYFYADLKNPDKAVIAKKLYHANYQMLESWLHCLTDLRNRCAHYSRLYYWNFASVPNMGNFPYVPDRTLYTQIYILKLMYPDRAEWKSYFYTPLTRLLKKYQDQIQLNHIGFPVDWKDKLK